MFSFVDKIRYNILKKFHTFFIEINFYFMQFYSMMCHPFCSNPENRPNFFNELSLWEIY